MIGYGNKYEFVRDSVNGAELRIVIGQLYYEGPIVKRALGRSPILKKENNGKIFGTSIELYAECLVDGEFAELYTSSAYEFKVDVFKDDALIWQGFVVPELYSEPDIAPPYDVQIIATDGLGELKNYSFDVDSIQTVRQHLSRMLSHTGLGMVIDTVSDLRYFADGQRSAASAFLDFRIDLSHELGNSCYDVLQRLLSSLNASITAYSGKWLVVRNTDLIRLASEDGLNAFNASGQPIMLPVAHFGSMATNEWWPIGQLSTVVEPAKKSIVFQAPNNYKANTLSPEWNYGNSASYNEDEEAYVLPSKDSYITQHFDFGGANVGDRLVLKIKARNTGSPIIEFGGFKDQGIGIRFKAHVYGANTNITLDYYLEPLDSDRGAGSYRWVIDENASIEGDLALPAETDVAKDAQDIEVIIPLKGRIKDNGAVGGIVAQSVDVTVFNIDGIYPINVYDVSLSVYDQIAGYQADLSVSNNAREEGDTVEATISDGELIPDSAYVFMTGVALLPSANKEIVSWSVGDGPEKSYVNQMAEDYAMVTALPRMSYKGSLNVPRTQLPVLFFRDGTYYLPETYSYNLYDDEIEVDLISVPVATVEVESIVISQSVRPSTGTSSGSSGSSGGGIGGGIDLSGYAKKEEVTTLAELLASMWTIDEETGDLVTDCNVRIAKNVIIGGDMSSAAKGRDAGAAGGIIGVKVNGQTYLDDNKDGIIDLGTISGGGIGEITSQTITEALGYTPLSTAGGTISGTGDKAFIQLHINGESIPNIMFEVGSSEKGAIGWTANEGVRFTNEAAGVSLGIKDNGTPHFNGNTLIHSGNYSSYALPLSGGTISGDVGALHINRSNEVGSFIGYSGTNGTLGYLGFRDVGMPGFFDASWNAYFLIHSGNYSDYALPKSGGELQGTTDTPLYLNGSATGSYIGFRTSDKTALGYIGFDSNRSPFVVIGYNTTHTLIHSGNIGSYAAISYGDVGANAIKGNALGYTYGIESHGSPTTGGVISAGFVGYGFQLVGDFGGTSLYFRGNNNGVFTGWKTIAFTDSNVASANLLTPTDHGGVIVYNNSWANRVLLRSSWMSGIGDYIEFGVPSGTANTASMMLTQAGNVLIGTTTDNGAKLQVNGAISAFESLSFTRDYWNYITVPASAGNLCFNIGAAGTANTKMCILNTGNVLIGATTDTGEKLQVTGNILASGYVRGGSINIGADYKGDASVGYDCIERSVSGGTLYLQYYHSGHINLCQGGGNVLIGTTTDSGYKLDVNGASRIMSIVSEFNDEINRYDGDLHLQYRGTGGGSQGAKGTGNITMCANGGNVLIGTKANGSGNARVTIGGHTDIALSVQKNSSSLASVNFENTSTDLWQLSARYAGNENGYFKFYRYDGTTWKDVLALSSSNVNVNGNLIIAGDMSSTSDMRLKHRIDDVVFDLKTMAEMPIFTFRWKDGRDDRLHLGSSAQYWEKPAPWLVMGDETKTLNYAVLGVAGIKALAVTAVDHETRIKMLERKVNELETENRRLRYGN